MAEIYLQLVTNSATKKAIEEGLFVKYANESRTMVYMTPEHINILLDKYPEFEIKDENYDQTRIPNQTSTNQR